MYSEKLLMVDRETVRNMQIFIPNNKFGKLLHLVGFYFKKFYKIPGSCCRHCDIPVHPSFIKKTCFLQFSSEVLTL